MNRLHFLIIVAALALFSTSAHAAAPIDIGNKSQLFIDRVFVAQSKNIAFTQHPATPHPNNPLIKIEHPWEGWRLELYGSVLFDHEENIFKMWYLGIPSEERQEFNTCYATSNDGINWSKPLVGTIPTKEGKPTNVVLNCLLASVSKDNSDSDPNRRYKMVCWINDPKPQGGPHLYTSPDGLSWTRLSTKPICRSSDVITAYFDRQRQQYIGFPKLSTKVDGHVRRCFGLSVSDDFETWSEPYYVFRPDLRDDASSLSRIEQVRDLLDVPDDMALMRTEFYGIGVYQAESCVLGFPWVFTINNNARYGNHEGPSEIQLAVTRDMKTWKRPFRSPAVPQGTAGNWDRGFVSTAAEAVDYKDEVRLYYSGSTFTHGNPAIYREHNTGRGTTQTGSIGLATWKKDRFVSADAPAEGGQLQTVPFTFSGNRLVLNLRTKNTPEKNQKGQVVVTVCDQAGKPIATSAPISGDSLQAVVSFPDSFQVGSLKNQAICLRFEMQNAELFSFAFRD